jgi:hypothetical protein
MSNATRNSFSHTETTMQQREREINLGLKSLRELFPRVCVYSPIISSIPCKWASCYHGMARRQVVDGGNGLQTCWVDANVLNKLSQITDKGWSSSLAVGHGASNSSL